MREKRIAVGCVPLDERPEINVQHVDPFPFAPIVESSAAVIGIVKPGTAGRRGARYGCPGSAKIRHPERPSARRAIRTDVKILITVSHSSVSIPVNNPIPPGIDPDTAIYLGVTISGRGIARSNSIARVQVSKWWSVV